MNKTFFTCSNVFTYALSALILAGPACSKPVAMLETAKPLPIVDLTGVWNVTAEEGQDRTMQLVQKGATLEGVVPDGPVAGEVKGNHVKVWLLNNPSMLGIATVDGDAMEGTYPCSRENRPANWSATRLRAQETANPVTNQGK